MRKPLSSIFVAVLLLFGAFFLCCLETPAQQASVQAVPSVDLKRYSGKWFEIARYPNKFQKQCVGNTTAEYVLEPDGNIRVINRCLKKDGIVDEAIGKGKIEDKQSNSKLGVRFAPAFISFLPQVWGDYWIIDLDPNYQYAAVGDPKREYLWILSRKQQMDDATYQQILRRVEQMGFQPNKLNKTPQNVEVIKGSVVVRQ